LLAKPSEFPTKTRPELTSGNVAANVEAPFIQMFEKLDRCFHYRDYFYAVGESLPARAWPATGAPSAARGA
jgi:hypothetical protein